MRKAIALTFAIFTLAATTAAQAQWVRGSASTGGGGSHYAEAQ